MSYLPSNDCHSSLEISGNSEIVMIGVGCASITTTISRLVPSRAATMDRMNDLPNRVLIWLLVIGDYDLARATTMDCLADSTVAC